ncbi:Ada metal-binding domain-containing protein [Chryseobacterium kwangjuense]|uniref:Ada metal-binding domain-containing protein n=1 Tax=Chryseobacterium kwangjuense TaxID=267125 RepID=A0ABW9JYE8_9FLAO
MEKHIDLSDFSLRSKIRKEEICFGGNRKLKIYGKLHCTSGKRMKRENRVFFISETEALEHNYRPCGHCMKQQYELWKKKKYLN